MKYVGPKARRCRRQGMNLYGPDKYDKILQKKPYGPGKNAKTREPRRSEYANQLLEKQKVRYIYGVSEKQFRNIYDKATRARGETGEAIKQTLERRLDNAIYRAGFAMTRLQARQFAGHGLFSVNGRRVTVPSYEMKPGDVITARQRTKASPLFASILAAHEKYMPPSWMKVNASAMSMEIVGLPMPHEAEQAVDMRQVIELYSRN